MTNDFCRTKKEENGNIEVQRISDTWDVAFTNHFRNIRREHTIILTHPKHYARDEDVDYFMYRE
ncbi:hypothetical protein [Musicola keenii]|uniref:hypothetical protein n=1 Tax=Musicola keenii TaxID=2884250 RepID=UPI0017876B55|nr:hypothetical protein [Musicola keenii]